MQDATDLVLFGFLSDPIDFSEDRQVPAATEVATDVKNRDHRNRSIWVESHGGQDQVTWQGKETAFLTGLFPLVIDSPYVLCTDQSGAVLRAELVLQRPMGQIHFQIVVKGRSCGL